MKYLNPFAGKQRMAKHRTDRKIIVVKSNVFFKTKCQIISSIKIQKSASHAPAILSQRYATLLAREYYQGTTMLYDLLKGEPKNLRKYLSEIREGLNCGKISIQKYASLLMHRTKAGCSSLHSIFKGGRMENFLMFLQEVASLRELGTITAQQYRSLLISPNDAGNTPLHWVLKTENPTVIERYFDELFEAIALNTITNEDYHRLLQQPNKAGNIPLNYAVMSGDWNIVTQIISIIKSEFDLETALANLLHQSKDGIDPRCPSIKENAQAINLYLAEEIDKLQALVLEKSQEILIPSTPSPLSHLYRFYSLSTTFNKGECPANILSLTID